MGNRTLKAKRKRKVSVIKGMSNEDVLKALETLAGDLGIEIRNEKGDFKSGSCLFYDQNLIILKKDDQPNQKIEIIAEMLLQFDIKEDSIKPEILQYINQIKQDKESKKDSEEE